MPFSDQFRRDGFIQFGLSSRRRLTVAQRVLDCDLAAHGPAREASEWAVGRLDRHDAFLDLLNDEAVQTELGLLLDLQRLRPVDRCQIALRTLSDRVKPLHIDGYYPRSRFLTEPLTAIVGVYLNDVLSAMMGNLRVVPGSHLLTARYFRVGHDPHPHPDPTTIGISKLAEQQIVGPAGTVIVFHSLLWHTNAANLSHSHIRKAVFFRLFHENLRVDDIHSGIEAMRDPWRDWRVRVDAQAADSPVSNSQVPDPSSSPE